MHDKKSILLQNGYVVTMDAQQRILRADILIEDGIIVKIGTIPGNPNYTTIDCSRLIILPGLIQTHTHLCQTLFRGQADDLQLLPWLKEKIWPLESGHDAATMRISARLGIAEMVKSGTTTIQDMGATRFYDEVFDEARMSGIRLCGGKCMMDLKESVPQFLLEDTKSSLRETERLIATWHGSEKNRLRYSVAPRFAVSCTPELIRESAALARQMDCSLHTHASENRDEIALIEARTKLSNIHFLQKHGFTGDDVTLAHCVWLQENEMEVLEQTKTSVAHCPASNLKLASGFAPIVDLLRHDICVSLGTDGAPCNNNHDMFFEMRLAALIHKPRYGADAITAHDVVKMATIEGARALNLHDEIGSIEVNKKADIIGISDTAIHSTPSNDVYSKIVYSMSGHDVDFNMVDGTFLMQNRELQTMDEAEILASVQPALNKVYASFQEKL
ncbi:MAG: 5'-deoxyadenosine deaminase [Calditrichaeota bacterium]|nr:MAG: 5'-deoxyadenosine deaminase [Calditrichota bacterium]